jgi:hypothetical protein
MPKKKQRIRMEREGISAAHTSGNRSGSLHPDRIMSEEL